MLLTFRAIYYLIPFALGGLAFLLLVLVQGKTPGPKTILEGES